MWSCSKKNYVYLSEYLNGTFTLLSLSALKVLNQDLVFRNGQFGAWSARKPITRDRTGQDCFTSAVYRATNVQLSICSRFKV